LRLVRSGMRSRMWLRVQTPGIHRIAWRRSYAGGPRQDYCKSAPARSPPAERDPQWRKPAPAMWQAQPGCSSRRVVSRGILP
jgi:hypothetical protein